MGREQKQYLVSAWGASFSYLLVLLVPVDCHAQSQGQAAENFSATASGPPSARTVACARGGTGQVAAVNETIPFDAFSFSTFTLQCQSPDLDVLPTDAAAVENPKVCKDASTLDSCSAVPLEQLEIDAVVEAVKTGEKTIQWKIYPRGFPRIPQKWKVGCVFQPPADKPSEQEDDNENVFKKTETPTAKAGCLVTVLVRQAPPVVVNNMVECSFGRIPTITPVISVTSSKPLVGIECGSGADFVPQSGGYCSDPRLDTCTPHSLRDIFPQYLDSWWDVDKDERVLTIPEKQLPKQGEKLFFGCVLRGQTVESGKKEDYYCVVPVLFESAAQPQRARTTLKDRALLWLTVLVYLVFIVTRVT